MNQNGRDPSSRIDERTGLFPSIQSDLGVFYFESDLLDPT